jgi:lysozyme
MIPVAGATLGLDVSHWNGRINWPAVASSSTPWGPVRWVYVKASEGATGTDSRFLENVQGAANAGLSVGAYHFARPDKPTSAEVGNFISQLESAAGYLTLPPMLDLEQPPAGAVTKGPVLRQWVNDFAASLVSAGYDSPVLYVGTNYSNKYLGNRAVDLAVWVPQYNRPPLDYTGDEGGPKWLNKTTSDWSIWQFSSKGQVPGIQGNVDLNAARVGWSEMQKSQLVRLLDVPLGAALIWVGTRQRRRAFRYFLVGAGLGTIIYNARNYLANK